MSSNTIAVMGEDGRITYRELADDEDEPPPPWPEDFIPPPPVKRERTVDDADVKPRKRRSMARKECVKCCNDVVANRFPQLCHVKAQQHVSKVCFGCWDQHLKTEVENKGFEGVSCPQCSHLLQEPEVRRLARKSTYAG